jgi:hypothetical protein
MKFTAYKEPIPYVIIDEVYNEEELQRIYRELEFLYPKLLDPTRTGTATDKNNVPIKKNRGVFLEDLYLLREFSDILTINRKLYTNEVYDELIKASPLFSLIKSLNKDTTLVSYYENSDYYEPHSDSSIITTCTWFFQEPQNFTGGDFILSDYNIRIPVRNNQAIIIFGSIRHEVTEIKMIDSSKICSGRFTLSNFISQRG